MMEVTKVWNELKFGVDVSSIIIVVVWQVVYISFRALLNKYLISLYELCR